MKKIIFLSFLLLVSAGTAFAVDLASGDVSIDGMGLYGGVDTASANAAPSPLVKFSSKVNGQPAFNTTAYSLCDKHQTGNKVFGTSNDATQIYWKQSIAGKLGVITAAQGCVGADLSATKFVGGGWTAY